MHVWWAGLDIKKNIFPTNIPNAHLLDIATYRLWWSEANLHAVRGPACPENEAAKPRPWHNLLDEAERFLIYTCILCIHVWFDGNYPLYLLKGSQ